MLCDKKGLLLLLLIFVPALSFGQAATNSPYSKFGIGDHQRIMFTRSLGMGGITLGMRDPGYIDFINPASLGARDSLSFLFEFGMIGKQSELAIQGESATSRDINFKNLAMAFPVTKWLGASAGITPYSSMNYNIQSQTVEGDPEYNPDIGEIHYLYQGSGGVHLFFFGLGANVYKGFSVGVNLSYLFGNTERTRSLGFVDEENSFSTKIGEKSIIGDLGIDFGFQYTHVFKDKYELTIGAILNSERKMSGEYESNTVNILSNPTGGHFVDTLEFSSGVKGKIQLPKNLGIGFTFAYSDKLIIGADYYWQNWSKAKFFGESDSLVNSSTLNAGLEYTPNRLSLRNYIGRISYRVGGHYSNSYLQLEGEQLRDFGISFGVGLPLNRNKSGLNISFVMGKRGLKQKGLIEEKYGMITFSLNLYDRWFVKRQFD